MLLLQTLLKTYLLLGLTAKGIADKINLNTGTHGAQANALIHLLLKLWVHLI